MDYAEFEKRYGTEQQCLEYLLHLRWEYGYRCPRCGCDEKWEIRDYKYKCKGCGYQTTVLAGTLFQDTHIPITLWFWAMWYVSENNNLTAKQLQQELNLGSNHTAQKMLRKIRLASNPQSEIILSGTVEVNRYIVRIGREPAYLVLAIEHNGRNNGYIKARVIKTCPDNAMNSIIREWVKPGSDLIIHTQWNDWQKLFEGEYTLKAKHPNNFGGRLNKTLNKFISMLYSKDGIKKIEDYCKKYNNRHNQIKAISFEELLDNAIHLPPVPYIGESLDVDKKTPTD